VRVRLLLDDVNLAGRDAALALLDSHPNIEVRVYNPFARRNGVGRALTNSLASNDVTPNHAAYARRRERMVDSGMELHEWRPDAASCRELVENAAACVPPHVFALHAKTCVLDRHTVYVGSLNLNMRSRYLNAESRR